MQKHITVLLQETVNALQVTNNDTIVDATYGGGGHTELVLDRLGPKGTCISIDVDKTAFVNEPKNPNGATVHLVNENFENLQKILRSLHIESVDGVMADLGWRMEQFDQSGKGLSFMHNEPLTMTYGDAEKYSFTAYDIVNAWDEAVLADIIFGYGEERFARRIAKHIIEVRKEGPITNTFELRDTIMAAMPAVAKRGRIHPATKAFQALRIAVNSELQVLETFITQAFTSLATDGHLAIISFHSLEDRIVKHAFRALAQSEAGTIETKKPIEASAEEREINPRARSAKLRVIRKNNVEHYEQNTTTN